MKSRNSTWLMFQLFLIRGPVPVFLYIYCSLKLPGKIYGLKLSFLKNCFLLSIGMTNIELYMELEKINPFGVRDIMQYFLFFRPF
jgi:hypothetical protein